MKQDVIRLENVSKIYDMGEEKIFALDEIDLNIEKNDFVSILGPSGSGKSTLLHILGLLDDPTSGKVFLDGVEINKLNEDTRAHLRGKKIGFVFQTFNLVPSLTVLENVALPAVIYEQDEYSAHSRATKILEKIGMGDRLLHYPGQLSGGQRQRVAIARALVNEPEIVLADEPTGNLDSKTGSEVLKMFRGLHEEGKTIAIITHDASITKITKRIIRIKDGKITG
ncbi:ABC transporter ATP-binding protein [Candidatus Micrarchaeota archaeon]|nr:ABC transporter ATP-binding protein [Candidatus Micrarchaeota archaeon]